MVQYECSDEVGGPEIGLGLVNGLLIVIPLWVAIGVVLAVEFEIGPVAETGSFALMIAAVLEAILLRPHLRALRERFRRYLDFRRAYARRNAGWRRAGWANHALGDRAGPHRALENISGRSFESIEDLLRYVEPRSTLSHEARPVVAPQVLLRQSLALSALVGAYLQYYFLEINLQIASLHSITVFAPVASMT
jgi:hypothetical protein